MVLMMVAAVHPNQMEQSCEYDMEWFHCHIGLVE